MKKIIAIILAAATLCSLVSLEAFAASTYTVTLNSWDGTVLFTLTDVPNDTYLTVEKDGLSFPSGEKYTYEGEKKFLGFAQYTSEGIKYAPGETVRVFYGNLNLYVVEGDSAEFHTIVGENVSGATSYELYEKDSPITMRDGFPYYTIYHVVIADKNDTSKVEIDKYYTLAFSKTIKSLGLYAPLPGSGDFYIGITCLSADLPMKLAIGEGSTVEESIEACRNATPVEMTTTSYNHKIRGYSSALAYSVQKRLYYNRYLSTMTTENPYTLPYVLYASSNQIDFDLWEIVSEKRDYTFVVKAKGVGYYDSDYSNEVLYHHVPHFDVNMDVHDMTVTDIDGETASNIVFENHSYSLKLIPHEGYALPDTVTITMDGAALTSSQYKYYPETGLLVIYKVTGELSIEAYGCLQLSAPEITRVSDSETAEYPIMLMLHGSEHDAGYSVYINGTKTNEVDIKMTDALAPEIYASIDIKASAISGSGTYEVYVIAEPKDGYLRSQPSNVITANVVLKAETPVIAEIPELETEEYAFVCSITKSENALTPIVYINHTAVEGVSLAQQSDGSWIAYFSSNVFTDGENTIYVIAPGVSGYGDSAKSNTLTFTITKLAAPEISLQ